MLSPVLLFGCVKQQMNFEVGYDQLARCDFLMIALDF